VGGAEHFFLVPSALRVKYGLSGQFYPQSLALFQQFKAPRYMYIVKRTARVDGGPF
jgi:hypothetical protein